MSTLLGKIIKVKSGNFDEVDVLVDDEDYDFLSSLKWIIVDTPRTMYVKNGKIGYMHRYLKNINKSNVFIDHINHNGLDNRKSNLRTCTRSQNQRNKSSALFSSSKFLGVSFCNRTKKWVALIRDENSKQRYIGRFINEIDAAKAYDIEAIKYHKEFANLNFK